MPHRIIETPDDLAELAKLFGTLKLPITVEWVQGRDRTPAQNRLQRLWCNEIAEQMGDQTAEEVRGYCKLRMGVPILRAASERFRASYDRVIKPLSYEAKIEAMMEPIDFPVTRMMKVRQKVAYLDAIHEHFSRQGVRLTDPEPDLGKYLDRYRAKETAA